MSEYINKDETVTILERLRDRCGNDDMAFALNWAADTVKSMSAADVEEIRHGKWFPVKQLLENWSTGERKKITTGYYCSECGHEEKYKYRYCNCGAKMDKEKEE